MFSHPFPNAFGLDINDLSIKLVALKEHNFFNSTPTFEVVAVRSTRLPHGLIIDGQLEQPEQVRSYIQHLIQGNGRGQKPIRSPWVVASLPDQKGFLKLIHIPKNPEDLIEEDILSEAKKHIPFESDTFYVDWQIMGSKANRNRGSSVLISAVQKSIADMHTYLLESLGLGVIALETEPLSIARTMITANKSYEGEARAILELGATRSTIIIFDHGHVQFSGSLSFSGEIITTAISQAKKISYEEAEDYKFNYGLEFEPNSRWPALDKLVDNLVEQIQKTISFYYSHFPEPNKITHITMCGGGAMLKRLDKILSMKLKIKSAPGHVWKNLNSKKSPKLEDQKSLSFTTAIGLALRAANGPWYE